MEISDMEKNMAKMLDAAGLFEVNVPDFKQLKQCRKEIKLLKTLWDYVVMVRSSFDDWKTTPWKEINVEQMDMDCKKFAKDIRSLDKEMRAWDSYTGVDNCLKSGTFTSNRPAASNILAIFFSISEISIWYYKIL
jgi:dynein heavy chain